MNVRKRPSWLRDASTLSDVDDDAPDEKEEPGELDVFDLPLTDDPDLWQGMQNATNESQLSHKHESQWEQLESMKRQLAEQVEQLQKVHAQQAGMLQAQQSEQLEKLQSVCGLRTGRAGCRRGRRGARGSRAGRSAPRPQTRRSNSFLVFFESF